MTKRPLRSGRKARPAVEMTGALVKKRGTLNSNTEPELLQRRGVIICWRRETEPFISGILIRRLSTHPTSVMLSEHRRFSDAESKHLHVLRTILNNGFKNIEHDS